MPARPSRGAGGGLGPGRPRGARSRGRFPRVSWAQGGLQSRNLGRRNGPVLGELVFALGDVLDLALGAEGFERVAHSRDRVGIANAEVPGREIPGAADGAGGHQSEEGVLKCLSHIATLLGSWGPSKVAICER